VSYSVIDASLWVSRLVPGDNHHPIVKTWLESQRAAGGIFLSPSLLLAEVGGAISRRTGEPGLARRAIDQLLRLSGLRLVEMDRGLVREAARLASDLGLRGADSFYVAVAARLGLPLVTLDADQRSRAETVVAVEFLGVQ
jgi:predicted nucleic acid-binding protein